jgi:rare lipoprotein A
MRRTTVLCLLLACVSLGSGCAAMRPFSPVAQGTEIEAPILRPADTSQYGSASFYGGEFNGRATANGEIFDERELTAAHRTLEFGTRVRVTNLANTRSVVVTVNDRGPFVRGRVIDLSRRAAQVLGFVDRGTARVRLEAVL